MPADLLSLPAELRNIIFFYTISDTVQDDLPINMTAPKPPLTRTCRAIRYETLPLYYGHSHGFYFSIALDDEAAAPKTTEAVLKKWVSTRAEIPEEGSERLKWVQVVYVSCLTSRNGRLYRGWPSDTHLSKTGSQESHVLEKLLPMAYSENHDTIGTSSMNTFVSYREGLRKEQIWTKRRYLYHLALHGSQKALELEGEVMEETDRESYPYESNRSPRSVCSPHANNP